MTDTTIHAPLDILALAAHRDDVEQTCGGTLLKMAERGYRTGIVDLTQGEMGTRGNAEDRAREAGDAARLLRVSWRHALDIPDGRVENTWENRLKVARVIREQRPRIMFVFLSDGILDARNKVGDMFGRHRVEEVVKGCVEKSAECVVTSLFKAVAKYSAGVESFDDQTVVAIKVKETPPKRK